MGNTEVKEGKSTWWIHIDFTVIIVIVVLVGIGWYVKSEYDKNVVRERVKLEIARKEREQKEQEARAEAEERQKAAAAENERKRKEALDYARQQQADRERQRAATAAKEEERREKEIAEFKARKEREEMERNRLLREAEEAAKAEAASRGASLTRTREQNIQIAREQYAAANREIDELNKRMDAMPPKMIAYKNKMDYAIKNNAQLKNQLDSYVSANRTAASKSTATPGSDYLADDIMKTASKNESVAKEYRDAANGLMALQVEKENCALAVAAAKAKKENALLQLKTLGAELAPQAAAKPATSTEAPKPTGKTIYVMKDGRRLTSVRSVDAGDTISIKTESGKFEAVNKEDIEKTIEE